MRSDAAWTAGHSAAQGAAHAAAVVFALTGVAVVRESPRFAGVVLVGMCVGAGVLLAGARRAGLAADRADFP